MGKVEDFKGKAFARMNASSVPGFIGKDLRSLVWKSFSDMLKFCGIKQADVHVQGMFSESLAIDTVNESAKFMQRHLMVISQQFQVELSRSYMLDVYSGENLPDLRVYFLSCVKEVKRLENILATTLTDLRPFANSMLCLISALIDSRSGKRQFSVEADAGWSLAMIMMKQLHVVSFVIEVDMPGGVEVSNGVVTITLSEVKFSPDDYVSAKVKLSLRFKILEPILEAAFPDHQHAYNGYVWTMTGAGGDWKDTTTEKQGVTYTFYRRCIL